MREVTVVAIIDTYVVGETELREAGKAVQRKIGAALTKAGLMHVQMLTVCPDTKTDQLVQELTGKS